MGRTHWSRALVLGHGPLRRTVGGIGEQRQPDVLALLEAHLDPAPDCELRDGHVDDVGGQPDPGILLDGHDADDVGRRHRRRPHVLVHREADEHARDPRRLGRQIRGATGPADRSGRMLERPAVGATAEPQHAIGAAGPEELGLGHQHRQRWRHGGHSMRAHARVRMPAPGPDGATAQTATKEVTMGAIDGPVAFVTGASRGIGKAVAIAFAQAGYDVAITARSQVEGEEREHSSTVRDSNTSPLPGSLQLHRGGDRGHRPLGARGALGPHGPGLGRRRHRRRPRAVGPGRRPGQQRPLCGPGAHGPLPRYAGRAHCATTSRPMWSLPLHILKMVLPGMLERGSGTVITMTSGAGSADPPAPAGAGGWGMGYSVSKGALHRVAGVLAVEHADSGHPLLQRESRRGGDGADQGRHGRLRLRRREWAPPALSAPC